MDPIDVRLLRELERGLPFVPAPFDEIGKRLGLSGDEVVERIRLLKEAGYHPEIPGTHRPAESRDHGKRSCCMETGRSRQG